MSKYIKDRPGVSGIIIGLAFPIDVGYKTINGPEAWKQYQKDMDTVMRENALLISHIRHGLDYSAIREIVEASQ